MTDMETRTVKDAVNLETGEKIYFTGHAQATYMSDGRTVEDAISQSSGGGGGDNIYADLEMTKERFAELVGRDFYCPLLSEAPNESTFTYIDTDGSVNHFAIGQECRVPVEESSEYVFYKFMGTYSGRAVWMKVAQTTGSFDANAYIDLSMRDIHGKAIAQTTANCYVVSRAGMYMFPVAYGASIKNGATNPKSYTWSGDADCMPFVNYQNEVITAPYIEKDTGFTPASAEITVSDEESLITNLEVKTVNGEKYVTFTVQRVPSTGANAVVSVLDESGAIMWSWHIWLWSDDLTPETIVNATEVSYQVLPVNIGSKWDDESKVHIKNWFYQWGRPTPMMGPSAYDSVDYAVNYGTREFIREENPVGTYGQAIQSPNKFFGSSVEPYNWFGTASYYNLWDASATHPTQSDVIPVKTVYDPSPVGFVVPNGNAFTGFSLSNVVGGFNGGWRFKKNSNDDKGVFFPSSNLLNGESGVLEPSSDLGGYWLSSSQNLTYANAFMFRKILVNPQAGSYRTTGFSIRPIQEKVLSETLKTTIRVNQNITDPESMITRIEDFGGIEAIRSHSHRYTGSLNEDGVMELKQLDDTDGTKYLDGTDAELTTYGVDVWMKLPQFYWKCTGVGADIWEISFAFGSVPEGVGWKFWDGKDLIGVYEAVYATGSGVSGLFSVSGIISTGKKMPAYYKNNAKYRGEGYSIVKWKHHCMMAALFYAYYNHTDSQLKVGEGTNSYHKAAGETNILGMEDTVAEINGNSQSINFWGLENWWGNKFEFIENVSAVNSIAKITEDDGTVRSFNQPSLNGWVTKMVFGENMDLLPVAIDGSSSTGFCDDTIMMADSSTAKYAVRGGYSSQKYGGVSEISISIDATSTSDYIGSRLAFRGDYVIV